MYQKILLIERKGIFIGGTAKMKTGGKNLDIEQHAP